MLSSTLIQIEAIIAKKLNNKKATNEILEFLKLYKLGMWIYPGVLRRKFNVPIEAVYEILNEMEKEGIVQSYYELVCSRCQKAMGIVRLFNELPDTFTCEICNEELATLSNAFLIYKVVVDE